MKIPRYYYNEMKYTENININKNLINYNGNKKFRLRYLEEKTHDELFELVFNQIYEDGLKKIFLSNEIDDNISHENSCVVILIDNKIAYIDKLESDTDECVNLVDFDLKNKGSFYLKMSIKMLKKYKEKLGIKKIRLKDNATIKCNNKGYSLSKYLLLTRGISFYGKEGFELCNEDKRLEELSLKNVILKLTVKDINWKYILRNYKFNGKNRFLNLCKENKNMKYTEFMKGLFNKINGEKTCNIYFIMERELEKFIVNKYDLAFSYYQGGTRELKL